MWKLLRMFCRSRDGDTTQENPREPRISQICVAELASFRLRSPDQLMIFDLRESGEMEEHPYTILGALLTTNVNLHALVAWIPPETVVVLYVTSDLPPDFSSLHCPSRKLRFYALEGGLRSWREAGLPLERFGRTHASCALLRGDCSLHSKLRTERAEPRPKDLC